MTDVATVMQVMFDDMPDDKRASNRVGRSYPGKHYFLGQLLIAPTLHGLPHHAPCRLKTVNIVGSCTLWLTGIVPLSHSSDLFIALFLAVISFACVFGLRELSRADISSVEAYKITEAETEAA